MFEGRVALPIGTAENGEEPRGETCGSVERGRGVVAAEEMDIRI